MSKETDIVAEARRRFERAKAFYGPMRVLTEADTRFALGDSDNNWQWPDEQARERATSRRVCLTINTTAQHCNQIINEIRRNRPACKVSPVDNGADKETALLLGGLIRNIQSQSNADIAHDIAAEHSVYGGEGYWRIITEFEDEFSFDQAIRIKPIQNPNRVYIDPAAQEVDRSDAEWFFIFEDQSKESFKREYPDIDPSSWVDDRSGWMIDADTFVRAEYFYCDYKTETLVQLPDGTVIIKSEQPEAVGKERQTKIKQWKHCIIVGGHEKPLDKTDWPGKYPPIIRVVGKEVNVNGELIVKGIVRDLKDPARIVNYAYSETVQAIALQNKIPYIASNEAIEGFEEDWRSANYSTAAYLPFNAYDQNGNPLPKPERQQPAVLPAAQIQLLDLSLAQMRGASGQQNANFGIKSEAASGIGIQRLKTQGEVATFHFPDNLAIGLTYEAVQLIDLIPKIYTREKIVRILGLDGKESNAVLDPNMPGSFAKIKGDIDKIFNPSVGRYDVVIDTGPSFQTQRQESAAILAEYAKADPTLMAKAGDIIMRANDFYLSDEVADRLAKTMPPELIDDDDEEGKKVAMLTQQLQQAQMQLQQVADQTKQIVDENQKLKSGEQATMMQIQGKQQIAQSDIQLAQEKAQIDADLAREKAQLDAQVSIEKAQIDAQTKLHIAEMNAGVDSQIAAMNAPVSTPEEEEEFKASRPTRKVITIQAPSGGIYTGVIEEQTMEGDE